MMIAYRDDAFSGKKTLLPIITGQGGLGGTFLLLDVDSQRLVDLFYLLHFCKSGPVSFPISSRPH